MSGLDVSPFAPEIARVLLLRGAAQSTISWKDIAQRGAKKILDDLDDTALLGVPALANASMASSVRALLYLWSGWIDDCKMCSEAAPPEERLYLAGLCLRHAQRYDESKAIFKKLGAHPIYASLTESAVALLGSTAEPAVQRLREMLEFDKHWEPFLFCDLVTMAGAGKLKPAGENVIRLLQTREFELLLVYCCEKATGQKVTQRLREVDPGEAQRRAQERERRMKEDRRRRESHARQEQPVGDSGAKHGPGGAGGAPARGETVTVTCPKCGQAKPMPAALRGKVVRCQSCNGVFEVPASGAGAASAHAKPASAGAGASVVVMCPKCGNRMPCSTSMCGKATACSKCGATFIVPKAHTASVKS
jgi:hypothetical protein